MPRVQVYSSDVAFTPSVKTVQARKGSRLVYQRMEERGFWRTRITPDLAAFIEAQTSIFLATVSAEGQPYPAPRRAGRLLAGARRQDHQLCRFFR